MMSKRGDSDEAVFFTSDKVHGKHGHPIAGSLAKPTTAEGEAVILQIVAIVIGGINEPDQFCR